MEIYVSVASLFVAVCAVCFTAWQAAIQRKHNRISVKPHLYSLTNRKRGKSQAFLQSILGNNGLGPAYINKFEVYLDGERSDPEAAITEVLGDLARNSYWAVLANDYAMAPNEAKVILEVSFSADTEDAVLQVERELNRLDLVVEYSSAYESMPVFDSREAA